MIERRKKDRIEAIVRKADQMAASGKYRNWLDIETALRFDGYTEARRVLDSAIKRKMLNDICDANWKGEPDA